MSTFRLSKYAACASVMLVAALVYAGGGSVAAMKAMHSAPASAFAISQGKGYASQYGCNKCHSADLKGKAGFSPSIRAGGVLKEYNQTTFVRVLLTGVTASGGHVKPPMPVYGGPLPKMHGGRPMPPPMTKAKAAALYAYLKTQK